MTTDYIGKRIADLLTTKKISEEKMSLELGCNKSYINGVISNSFNVSTPMLFKICDYLDVSPAEFFLADNILTDADKQLLYILERIPKLNHEDQLMVYQMLKRLDRK